MPDTASDLSQQRDRTYLRAATVNPGTQYKQLLADIDAPLPWSIENDQIVDAKGRGFITMHLGPDAGDRNYLELKLAIITAVNTIGGFSTLDASVRSIDTQGELTGQPGQPEAQT